MKEHSFLFNHFYNLISLYPYKIHNTSGSWWVIVMTIILAPNKPSDLIQQQDILGQHYDGSFETAPML